MLRVTDAPGFYAAFPWGGYARSKGATGTRSDAIGARALYSPLSPPRIFHAWSFIRPRRQLTEQYTEGLHRSVPARGAVLYADKLVHASNTKGPLRRKTCTPKTAMTPVVATIS